MRRYIAVFIVICAFMMLFLSAAYSEDRSVTVKGKKGTDTAVSISAHYYALIIGNNNYKHLPKLKTAVNDAKAVEKILKNQYGFETKLLIDVPRKDILSAINDFRKKLSSKDSLLIYLQDMENMTRQRTGHTGFLWMRRGMTLWTGLAQQI